MSVSKIHNPASVRLNAAQIKQGWAKLQTLRRYPIALMFTNEASKNFQAHASALLADLQQASPDNPGKALHAWAVQTGRNMIE